METQVSAIAPSPAYLTQKSRGITNACWIFGCVMAVCGPIFSQSPILWISCVICLPLAFELAGGSKVEPIVAACLGLFWAAIFNSIVTADLNLQPLDRGINDSTAILNSLLALFAIAFGYRMGARIFNQAPSHDIYDMTLSTKRLIVAYWCAFLSTAGLAGIAWLWPSLTQANLALKGIKLLLLYIMASQIFSSREYFFFLIAAVVAEIILGTTGFIASYQIPLIVVLAAAINTHSGRLRFSQIAMGTVFALALLFISIVWTAIKPEYRFWLEFADPAITARTGARVQWIFDRVAFGSTNYTNSTIRLANRIGYTRFYAVALPRMESDSYQPTSYWLEAIENVLKPRFLFPDKPKLDDTRITSELTGIQFGSNVSVSIGFVAQAQSDFGFPLMYAPLALVGVLLGAIGSYFQSMKISRFARDGFMAAALVYKFTYETNIDKAIGGVLLSTFALLLASSAIYPQLERWASNRA